MKYPCKKKNIALVGQNIYHTIGSLENLPHGRKNRNIFSSPGRPRAPPLCRWLNGACQAWKIRVVMKKHHYFQGLWRWYSGKYPQYPTVKSPRIYCRVLGIWILGISTGWRISGSNRDPRRVVQERQLSVALPGPQSGISEALIPMFHYL